MSYPITSDLVMQGWLATLSAMAGVPVATRLPSPEEWGGSQLFVTESVVASSQDTGTPLMATVYQVDVWGRPLGQSTRPPFGATAALATLLERSCATPMSPGVVHATVGDYTPARVTEVSLSVGFGRVPDSETLLARYSGKVALRWIGE